MLLLIEHKKNVQTSCEKVELFVIQFVFKINSQTSRVFQVFVQVLKKIQSEPGTVPDGGAHQEHQGAGDLLHRVGGSCCEDILV